MIVRETASQQRSSPLPHLPAELRGHSVYQASADGVDENLLILLHGLGDTAAPFAKLAERMALPQTAALALGGPLPVPFAGRAWYPAFDAAGELIEAAPRERRRTQGLARTRAVLQALLPKLEAAGWPRRRVHLFGFADGGTVALDLALHCRGGECLGSCVSVSAALLEEALPPAAARGGHSGAEAPQPAGAGPARGAPPGGTRVLMTYGELDAALRPAVLASARALRDAGCEVEMHAVPGKGRGMVASQAEMRVLMAFWARALSHRPAGAEVPSGGGDLVEVSDPAGVEAVARFRP